MRTPAAAQLRLDDAQAIAWDVSPAMAAIVAAHGAALSLGADRVWRLARADGVVIAAHPLGQALRLAAAVYALRDPLPMPVKEITR